MVDPPTKQQQLVDTAGKLFMKFGVKRVTVAEICQEAGVSKMTFYKYFSNKKAIAEAFLQRKFEEGIQDYRNIMQQSISFAQKVEQMIQLKLENTEDISSEFVKDIYKDQQLGLHLILEEKQKEYLNEVLQDFAQAASNGEIRAGIKPEMIAYFLGKMAEMAADEQLIQLYENEQELIMEITKFFFYGLGIHHENH